MDFWIYLFLLASFIGASKANNSRGQTLLCYECAAKPGNNTCTSEFRQTVQSLGFDKRCRIMEMDGKVVSAGIVPTSLCQPAALAKVNKVKSQLNLIGEGDVYPYCCNFDYCNSDMCTAMKLPKGNPACVTTMTNKVEQAKLIQQGIINNNQAEVIQQGIISNNVESSSEKALASLQAAGFGGSLAKNVGFVSRPFDTFLCLGCALFYYFGH